MTAASSSSTPIRATLAAAAVATLAGCHPTEFEGTVSNDPIASPHWVRHPKEHVLTLEHQGRIWLILSRTRPNCPGPTHFEGHWAKYEVIARHSPRETTWSEFFVADGWRCVAAP
jgi:hypothetical protein